MYKDFPRWLMNIYIYIMKMGIKIEVDLSDEQERDHQADYMHF